MNILLLSTGGGGGNILRSLKTLFRRDLTVAQQADPRHADRLRRAVTTRFLDTNEFSLTDVPIEERVLIGRSTTRRLGSMHNPELARQALEESRADVESLMKNHAVIVVIGTGGKGTGAGTIFPLAEMARQQKKLVIPIFVRPSFERHEVEKRRYDHGLRVIQQFDAAKIRMMEILNDRGYSDTDPQPQSVVWERMNRPMARGLRGLLYVLWDLSQVDPSDLSALFAGHGRLRVGFSEIDPAAGREPSDEQIEEAVRGCWSNPYCAFANSVGTSLICIQGDWSNVVDGKIKSRLATLVIGGNTDNAYNPLYARVSHGPKPWGVTALFAEYTGQHDALEVDWPLQRPSPADRKPNVPPSLRINRTETVVVVKPRPVAVPSATSLPAPAITELLEEQGDTLDRTPSFSSFWEFALAINRSDKAALALARNGAECKIPIDGAEIRKLLTTVWFRSVFADLSKAWRDRILEALLGQATIANHVLRHGRRTVQLSQLTYDQLKEVVPKASVSEAVRSDFQLMLTVGTLWGPDALSRFEFSEAEAPESSRLAFWSFR